MSPEGQSLSRGANKKGQPQRRHRRYPYDGLVVLARPVGPVHAGRIRNLSEGGAMVEFCEPFPVGTLLELVLSLGGRSIRAEVKVVWSQASPDQTGTSYRHGLEFTRLYLQDQVSLELFLAEVLRG